MMISDHKVEEVRAASDIVDVVGDYVRLKPSGSNYFGLCPFHTEKSPSFSVNQSLGIFKCFGCGVSGDVFKFIERVEQLSFPEAVRLLAKKAGIDIPVHTGDQAEHSELEEIYSTLRFSGRFYHEQLTGTDAGRKALAYLEGRGFSLKWIRRFGLGYAPSSWDGLLRAAEASHIGVEALERAGLVIARKSGDGHYDRFRDRLMFPIMAPAGQVIGFGGRILSADSDQPKYINSPETRAYRKSFVLYGLYQARKEMRRTEEVLLVEGYTDVIALHQAGVANVVAVSGTALTPDQVKLIGRYARRITLLFDADFAGEGATLRSINLALEGGLQVFGLSLPAGEDPDSYLKQHGAEAFQSYALRNRRDFVAFKWEMAQRKEQLATPDGRAAAARDIVETIARMPDALLRESYVRHAGELTGIPDIRLFEVLSEVESKRSRQPVRRERPSSNTADVPQEAPTRKPPAKPEMLPEEQALIRLMLEHGAPMVELVLGSMAREEFTPGISRDAIDAIIDLYQREEDIRKSVLDGDCGPALRDLAAELLIDRYMPSHNWARRQNIPTPRMNQNAEGAAVGAMKQLKLDRIQQEAERVQVEMMQAQRRGEDLRNYQDILVRLTTLRTQVNKLAFLQGT
jgi:DNA primase